MNDIPSTTLATFLAYTREMQLNENLNTMIGVDAEYNRVLATSLNEQSSVKSVLADEGESQLVTRKFTEKDESDSCPIFHTEFEIGEQVIELPCGHIFSPDGIKKWLKEEKAECPVCRFKLASKEITREQPGIEQWAEDRTEMSASRAALATNLRRLAFPTISQHPFGPTSHRITNVIHEDDNTNDLLMALAMTIQGSIDVNNNINSNRTIYVNDNDDHDSYSNNIINSFQFSDNNSTSPFSMNSYDYVTSYANNQPLPPVDQEEDSHISSQENQRMPDS